MNSVIKASVVLAVVVAVLSVIFAAAGLHEKGILPGVLLMVVFIALNVGCIFWALSATAADNKYGKQFQNVVVFGLIAGVLIFGASILNLTVLFPDYLENNSTAMIEFLEGANLPEDQLAAQVTRLEERTPIGESVSGAIGTFLTSLVVGAIVAVFKRKK